MRLPPQGRRKACPYTVAPWGRRKACPYRLPPGEGARPAPTRLPPGAGARPAPTGCPLGKAQGLPLHGCPLGQAQGLPLHGCPLGQAQGLPLPVALHPVMPNDLAPNLRERLRRLGVVRGARALPPSPRRPVAVESVLPGSFHETPAGRCWLARTEYPAGYAHGRLPLESFLSLPSHILAFIGGDPSLATVPLSQALFLDTETTGLSGGTGTMAFLVGLGFFEEDRFVVLQAFLRDPGDEPAMIGFLAEFLPRFRWLVTFNGRGFDVPILQNRFVLARRPFPLDGVPHLDLLPPSRRLWWERLVSCSLTALERDVLGVVRDQADIPSGVIPLVYRDYLRTGDAREIPRILYHNRMDILSMPVLAAYLGRVLVNPEGETGLSGEELGALARWYGQAGWDAESLLLTTKDTKSTKN